MTPYALLTAREYALARRADHGSLWRFLAGCRCIECDRPAHHRFRAAMRPHRQVVDSSPMQAATVDEDAPSDDEVTAWLDEAREALTAREGTVSS